MSRRATPNNELRRLRCRPQSHLTQAEVARRIVELVRQATGRTVAIDADYVSRLERGLITWPDTATRAAFRNLFDVPTDLALGFHDQRSPDADPANGNGAGPLPALSAEDLVPMAQQATFGQLDAGRLLQTHLLTPPRIRPGDVADLHTLVSLWEHFDHRSGGLSPFRNAVLTQVAQAEQALSSASFENATVRQQWISAMSRAARLAAFSSFDAREHIVARQAFVLALQAAAEADDWPARINILCGMARQSLYTGHPCEAQRLVSLARIGEDDSSATTRAMIGAVRARAFAALGRPEDAMRAVGEAEDAFSHRDQSSDPPWLWYYDEAQVSGDTGHALYELATADERFFVPATEHLSRAVLLHNPDETSRSRSFSLCKLTALRLKWDPSPDALALAEDAIDSVSRVRSGRSLDDLANVGRLLPTDSDAARSLARRITAITAAE